MLSTENNNRRILVIDNDLDIWQAYGQVLDNNYSEIGKATKKLSELVGRSPDLNKINFQINFAAQGQEGVDLVIQAQKDLQPYAVAFIDVRMPPGIDGLETAALIRQLDNNIEIVIVTAYSDRSREEIASTVGACDKLLFIRKPFDAEELMQLAISLTDKWQITINERQQRHHLQAIFQTSPAAIFTLNKQGLILSWNPKAQELTGRSQIEVKGHSLFAWLDNQEPALIPTTANLPNLGSHEITISDATGKELILALQINEMTEDDPEVALIGSFWDITKIKQAELALLASENRFRNLVETTSDWVWEIDRQGCFTYCSPICEELYGYRVSELLNKPFYEILLTPANKESGRQYFQECLQNGKVCQAEEREYRGKDGSPVFIESSGVPIFAENGDIIGYRGIDRDITRRKSDEEKLNLLAEQQRQSQKLGALGTLAGGIAHDMNNILTPILGFSELALMQAEPGSTLYRQLQNITTCSEKAADLIRQIVDFSRKQPVKLMAISINEVINNFLKMLRRLIREDIDLQVDFGEDLWQIDADRSQMEQVLVNLIVNARDAMENQGEVINISTRQEVVKIDLLYDINHQPIAPGEYIVLQVKDQGSGMDQTTMEQIFDPFYTTKEVGQGTGLGLSTVYGIIGQHSGAITLQSSPGQGSIFEIYLPRGKEKKDEHIAKCRQLTISSGQERLLLVEDNSELQKMLATILTDLGYNIILAKNGQEGLSLYHQQKDQIDLVISDVIMPIMGGVEMAQKIIASNSKQPILFITGHAVDTGIHDLIKTNNCQRLDKPFTLAEITKVINELLHNIVTSPKLVVK